jgi:hypothetical protein
MSARRPNRRAKRPAPVKPLAELSPEHRARVVRFAEVHLPDPADREAFLSDPEPVRTPESLSNGLRAPSEGDPLPGPTPDLPDWDAMREQERQRLSRRGQL